MKKFIPNILLLLALTSIAYSQTYSIDWHKVAAGGGSSSKGIYSMNSTIGQPFAGGAMTGGNYSVTSGFWSLFAVQSPGAPMLRIFLTTTNTAIVAWPSPSAGYTLQSSTNLAGTNWLSVINATNIVGSENQVMITPVSGNRYFRLKNP